MHAASSKIGHSKAGSNEHSKVSRIQYIIYHKWNMDETGVSNVKKPGNTTATKGTREVGKMTTGKKGKTVTIMCYKKQGRIYF